MSISSNNTGKQSYPRARSFKRQEIFTEHLAKIPKILVNWTIKASVLYMKNAILMSMILLLIKEIRCHISRNDSLPHNWHHRFCNSLDYCDGTINIKEHN